MKPLSFTPIPLAAAAAVVLALTGASVQAQPGAAGQASQCFRVGDIQNSVQTSRTQMNIKTVQNTYFQIDTKGICFVGRGNLPYGMSASPGSGGIICKPIDMDLVGGESGDRLPCIVDKITPLTKDQMLALPKRDQPG
jgi:hypothetical protein